MKEAVERDAPDALSELKMRKENYADFNPLQNVTRPNLSDSLTSSLPISFKKRKSHLAGTGYRRGRSLGMHAPGAAKTDHWE